MIRDERILATLRAIAKSHPTYGEDERVAITADEFECEESEVREILLRSFMPREHPGYSIAQTECGTIVDVEV